MLLLLFIALITAAAAYRRLQPIYWIIACALAGVAVLLRWPTADNLIAGVLAVAIFSLGLRPLRQRLVTGPLFARLRSTAADAPVATSHDPEIASLISGKPGWNAWLQSRSAPLAHHEYEYLSRTCRPFCAGLSAQEPGENDWERVREAGLFALALPRTWGGPGLSLNAQLQVLQMIAGRNCEIASTLATTLAWPVLVDQADQDQKRRIQDALEQGQRAVVFAQSPATRAGIAQVVADAGGMPQLVVSFDARVLPSRGPIDAIVLPLDIDDPEQLLETRPRGPIWLLVPIQTQGIDCASTASGRWTTRRCSGSNVELPITAVIADSRGETLESVNRSINWFLTLACDAAIQLGAARAVLRSVIGYVRATRGGKLNELRTCRRALARSGAAVYRADAVVRSAASHCERGSGREAELLAQEACADARERVRREGRAICRSQAGAIMGSTFACEARLPLDPDLTRDQHLFLDVLLGSHPFWLRHAAALTDPDPKASSDRFDRLLLYHLGFLTSNIVRSIVLGLTGSRFTRGPASSRVAHCYRHLSRLSAALAALNDVVVLSARCRLRRDTPQAARLGQALCRLYAAACLLKSFHEQGEPVDDLELLQSAVQETIVDVQDCLHAIIDNLPNATVATVMRWVLFPLGNRFRAPTDETLDAAARMLTDDTPSRRRVLGNACIPDPPDTLDARLEFAFRKVVAAQSGALAIRNAMNATITPQNATELVSRGVETGILTEEQASRLMDAQRAVAALDDDSNRLSGL